MKRGRPILHRDSRLMKRLFYEGKSYRWLARRFGVSLGTAFTIVNSEADREVIL